MKYIIYAGYGSNLLKERFIVYIKGGKFCGKFYSGSRDKTDPIHLGWVYVPHRLYFAKISPRWQNKGVAFLSCEEEENINFHAVVRLWRVSEIQFEDIKEQEGESWYGSELILGEIGGLEIKTFTGNWENEKNKPSQEYLQVIKRGLKETTFWEDSKIDEYLYKFL
jgi:hypothetical protein